MEFFVKYDKKQILKTLFQKPVLVCLSDEQNIQQNK